MTSPVDSELSLILHCYSDTNPTDAHTLNRDKSTDQTSTESLKKGPKLMEIKTEPIVKEEQTEEDIDLFSSPKPMNDGNMVIKTEAKSVEDQTKDKNQDDFVPSVEMESDGNLKIKAEPKSEEEQFDKDSGNMMEIEIEPRAEELYTEEDENHDDEDFIPSVSSLILPYQFEPESDPENEEDQADPLTLPVRLEQDVKDWCKCENCNKMPCEEENVCCLEIQKVLRRMNQVSGPLKCVTHHPGFEPNCLNPYSLQNFNNIYRADYGRVRRKTEEERYRFIAQQSFMSWCWGFMGKKVRVVLPSCVVLRIQQEFPDAAGQSVGFRPPLD